MKNWYVLVFVFFSFAFADNSGSGQQLLIVSSQAFTRVIVSGLNQDRRDTDWDSVPPRGSGTLLTTRNWWWVGMVEIKWYEANLVKTCQLKNNIGRGFLLVLVELQSGNCLGDGGNSSQNAKQLERYLSQGFGGSLGLIDQTRSALESLNDGWGCIKGLANRFAKEVWLVPQSCAELPIGILSALRRNWRSR
jgi:hypothetical protein